MADCPEIGMSAGEEINLRLTSYIKRREDSVILPATFMFARTGYSHSIVAGGLEEMS